MEGVPYWKLNAENQHTFNGIEEKTDSLKLPTLKNLTFAFDLTQIQVVSFQYNQFFIENHKVIKYGLKIIMISVCFCTDADIQYFAVSYRVYFLSNNVGIHFVLLSHMFFSTGSSGYSSGITPSHWSISK